MKKTINYLDKNSNIKIQQDVSLTKLTNYQVGGIASYVIRPKSINDLIIVLKNLKENKIKHMILGKGTNVLFSDKKYEGVIIKLDYLNKVTINKNIVTADAGASLVQVAYLAIKNSLAGLEFATGIPGTIGGAVYMNAGAYNSDMGYVVSKVLVLTPDYKIINMVNRECLFKYRTSFFKQNDNYIVLQATIKLRPGNYHLLTEVANDRKQRRHASQPLEYPSAGSVFRNPSPEMPAGKLVEDLKLKGKYIGGAQISEKHGNFIINRNQAKAQDIKDLIDLIKDKVKKEYQVDLFLEQELINWEE